MVGALKYYPSDPEGKGRGAGLYYHRGSGKYSKYDVSRDLRKVAKNPPYPRIEGYQHTGDVFAGIKRAYEKLEIAQEFYRGKERSVRRRQALEEMLSELSRITKLPKPKLRLVQGRVVRKIPFLQKIGGAAGYYLHPQYYVGTGINLKEPTIVVTTKRRAGSLALILFHEFGHHIHFTRKQPFDPTTLYKTSEEHREKSEQIARKFADLGYEILYGSPTIHRFWV